MTERFREQYPLAVYDEPHIPQSQGERHITGAMMHQAVFSETAQVFETYPESDTVNLLGFCRSGQSLHLRLTFGNPPETLPRIRSVYDPSVDPKQRWEADLMTRRRDRGGTS